MRRPISLFRRLDEEQEFGLADPGDRIVEELEPWQTEPVREPEYFVHLLAYLRERNRALASAAGMPEPQEVYDG